MGLSGSLDEFSLLDVLALLGARSGCLGVEVAGGLATLWLRDGGVGRADATWLPAGVPTAEVVFSVLTERGGRFDFESGEVTDRTELVPLAELSAQVDDLAQEWDTLSVVAPRANSVVELAPALRSSAIILDRKCWEAVRLLAAGPMTLTEVAADTGRSPMGARRLLHALFSAGGLAVDGLSAVPTGATLPGPSPAPPDRSAVATGISG